MTPRAASNSIPIVKNKMTVVKNERYTSSSMTAITTRVTRVIFFAPSSPYTRRSVASGPGPVT